MNDKREKMAKRVGLTALVLALMLLSATIGYTIAQSSNTFYISTGIYPQATYTIYKEGSTYYAKNSYGVQLIPNGSDNASYVINIITLLSSDTIIDTILLKNEIILTNPIFLYSYTHLIIDGELYLADNVQTSLIQIVTSSQSVSISGGGILHGNRDNNADLGIDGEQCGIYGSAIFGLKILELTVENCTREGIYISNSQGIQINNIITKHNGRNGLFCDADLEISVIGLSSFNDGMTATAPYFGQYGVLVVGGATPFDRSITLSGVFTYGSGICVYMVKNGATLLGCIAKLGSNAVYSSEGIRIESCDGVKLIGCETWLNDYQGFTIYSSNHISLIDCTAKNNGQANNTYEIGIWLNSANYTMITNCLAFDDETPKTQHYGCQIDNNCKNITLVSNWFYDNDVNDFWNNAISYDIFP